MFSYLKPDQYYQNIFKIELEKLKEQNIEGIICDIDNTIAPCSKQEIMLDVIDWFRDLKELGFQVWLVSNTWNKRVEYFCQKLDIPGIGMATKPRKRAYLKVLSQMNLKNEEVAVIGDQIFTDILGGNRLGFTTILVDPLEKREFITTKFLRMMEKLVFARNC